MYSKPRLFPFPKILGKYLNFSLISRDLLKYNLLTDPLCQLAILPGLMLVTSPIYPLIKCL